MMSKDIMTISRRMLRGTYERVSQRLLKGQPKPKPFGKLINGKWMTGTQSLHRTPQSRRWQMFWRLKFQRITKR
jgi:hypothetical protein